jgi:hypothetical protein
MSPTTSRLLTFALLGLGVFGSAYALAEALPGHQHRGSDANHSGGTDHSGTSDGAHNHDHGTPVIPLPGAGTTVMDGYRLVTVADLTGDERAVTFRVRDPGDAVVTDWLEHHGARLHVVLVRPDLSDFWHVHPDIDNDGSFTVDLPGAGPWRINIDALPEGAERGIVLATTIDDEVPFATSPLALSASSVVAQGLTIERKGLTFSVDADTEPYLGQSAHLIAVREGDLAYIHLHPMDMPDSDGQTQFMFAGGLPMGTWRLWLQFGHEGEVITAAFTVDGVAL